MLDDFGKLILRLAVGGLLLFHGLHKLLNGIAPIEAMLTAHHLPAALAYGVYLGEVFGPLLVLVGFAARAGAILIAVDMVCAVLLARTGAVLSLGVGGGYALEVELLFFFGAIAIALLGPGSLGLGRGRWH